MRVLLLVGFAFEGSVERDREIQPVRGDDLAGAALGSSSAALDQMHYRDAGNRGHGDQVEQRMGTLDHCRLKVDAASLEDPEILLDPPALAVPGDNLMGLRHGCHRVGRQQPPVNRDGADPDDFADDDDTVIFRL